MRTLLISFMVAWLALPNSQSASEPRVIVTGCQKCGGDIHYFDGASEGECDVCHEKVALIVVVIVVVVCVVGGTVIYSIAKFCKRKFPPPPSSNNGTNNITAKVWDGESATVLSFETKEQADQWLSLIPPSTGTARFQLEWTTNFSDWNTLPEVLGSIEDFAVIHTNPPMAGAFYRLRVNP